MKFYPPFKDEGEVIASWGEAELIRYLGGKTELRGGSKEDRLAAQEWISLFWHEAVVSDDAVRHRMSTAGSYSKIDDRRERHSQT
jgi:hypothetical protein